MTYWQTFYHLVWSTKNREPLISSDRAAIVESSVRIYASKVDATIHAIGMMPDHVHVAISIPPRVAVSDLVQKFKGGSSHLIGEREGTRTFSWQPQFGVFSFDEGRLASVVDYIHNQRQHHESGKLRPKLEITGRPR
jgi:putative transposase